MRVGIVLSRFNAAIGEPLLEGALRALGEAGRVVVILASEASASSRYH